MAWLLTLLMVVVIAACVGFLYRDGMWGNAVRCVCAFMAAILATNFFEPVARILEDSFGPKLTYFYDFVSFWLIFIATFLILHILTCYAAHVKVRFNQYLDIGGSVVFSLIIGILVWNMFLFSLHLAPLGTKPFGTEIVQNGNPRGAGWAAVMRQLSAGVFSRSVGPDEAAKYGGEIAVFPGNKNIFEVYLERAKKLESLVEAGSGFLPGDAPPR